MSHPFDEPATERLNPHTVEIDLLPTYEMVELLHHSTTSVSDAVGAALPDIARAVDAIVERLNAGGRLVYVGAGSSGRLGVLDASEVPPTFGVPTTMVGGLIAGGGAALVHSVEEVEDDADAGVNDVERAGVSSQDVVVGITASGRTPYVLGAVRRTRGLGAFTIGIANNRPCALESEVDIAVIAETGPEPIAGSTRLNAGTAQKLILNLLSTGAMVRLGRTYGNLMVDVRATNAKLRRRAERIVVQATGCSAAVASKALKDAGASAKLAVVMIAGAVDADRGRALLKEYGERARIAIERAQLDDLSGTS